MNRIKELIYKHPVTFRLATKIFNYLNIRNRLYARGVKLSAGVALLQGVRIVCNGVDNEVKLGDYVRMKNCTIVIRGSHNRIYIGDRCVLQEIEFCIEDDNNEIRVGNKTEMYGFSHFAAIEGTKILIGSDCLFSSGLHFRTGDSHSIFDFNGKRTNISRNIVIGDHVWVGTRVTCLKGVYVGRDSVVAATTTLCKEYNQENIIIGGVPGKIIKTEIKWGHDRVIEKNI